LAATIQGSDLADQLRGFLAPTGVFGWGVGVRHENLLSVSNRRRTPNTVGSVLVQGDAGRSSVKAGTELGRGPNSVCPNSYGADARLRASSRLHVTHRLPLTLPAPQ